MTREEFIDAAHNDWDWDELIDFCNECGCDDYIDDVWTADSYAEEIEQEISDRLNDENWREIRDWLDDLPDGCNYYIRDDYDGMWRGADSDDYDEKCSAVLEWCDDNDIWEYDEEENPRSFEEEDPDGNINTEDEICAEEESLSFDELFTSCSDAIQHIGDEDDSNTGDISIEDITIMQMREEV